MRKIAAISLLVSVFATTVSAQINRIPADDDYTLKYLLDAPAGKHGFVKISPKEKRLYFEDGTKALFYGVCFKAYFNDWSKKVPEKEMERLLDGLTVMGVNMIRNQITARKLYDFKAGKFRPVTIDNFDRFFYEMKKRGIYMHLNLNLGNGSTEKWPKLGEAYKVNKKYGLNRHNLIMNKCFIEPQKIFADKLLNHVNPYTKLAYKDEPGIISLQLGNEQHTYSRPGWRKWEKMQGPYRKEIEDAWNSFMKNKYKNQAALKNSWGTSLKAGENLDKGTVQLSNPRYARWDDPKKPTAREHDAVLFGDHMQRRFHDIMRDAISNLAGDKNHYISDNGWIRGNDLIRKTAHEKLDINDLQHYWPHGSRKRSENPYKMSPSRDAGPTILRSMLTAREYNGIKKPFYVTEFNSHADNIYAWEIFPVHTLFLALTGGDGQSMWIYSTNPVGGKNHWFGFNYESSPIRKRIAPFMAGAQMFREKIPECINTKTFESIMSKGAQTTGALSVDYKSTFKREYADLFKKGIITLDFKNGQLTVNEKKWKFYLGKGPFACKEFSFLPSDNKTSYYIAVFAIDNKDLTEASRIRVYSHAEGDLTLKSQKIEKAVGVDRKFAPFEKDITKNAKIRIDNLDKYIFTDITINKQ